MKIGQRLYDSIFPPSFKLSPKEQRLLEQMYPDINWDYVRCCDGMPWFMEFTFAIGTALPQTYNRRYLAIHFRNYEQMFSDQRVAILVHEAFHIQQYQELNSMAKNTSGWGFNRRFMRYYIGWYFEGLFQALFKQKKKWSTATQYAYRQHPMETKAYNQEAFFESQMSHYQGHSIGVFFQQIPELICIDAQLPKAPSFLFYLMGSALSFFISIVRPLVELILLPIAFLLGGRSKD
jgi:hypothetical protein